MMTMLDLLLRCQRWNMDNFDCMDREMEVMPGPTGLNIIVVAQKCSILTTALGTSV